MTGLMNKTLAARLKCHKADKRIQSPVPLGHRGRVQTDYFNEGTINNNRNIFFGRLLYLYFLSFRHLYLHKFQVVHNDPVDVH